jgi:outer membrane protein
MIRYALGTKVLTVLMMSSAHSAVSLKDAFEAARKNMETLKRADSTIEQRREQLNRARATILPNVSGVGSWTKLDPPNGAGASPFLLTEQYSGAIRLSQPLLRGGTLAAYQIAKENVLLGEFQKNSTELSLYQLVINAYYNLAIATMDVVNLQELKDLSAGRVKELRQRAGIGRSRRGEMVQSEAQLLAAEAQYQQGVISLQQAQQNFEFYTQTKPDALAPLQPVPDNLASLNDYLNKLQTRPDLLAVEQQIKVADKQVTIARGAHLPSLDLTSNYYLTRTGILATSDWDVGLAVVVPIFQGGGAQAAVREAVAGRRIAELNSSETKRAAARDLGILYQNYREILVQLQSQKSAMEKAKEAYVLYRRDYSNGAATNLEVLNTLNVFITNKRSYDTLYAMAHMTFRSLEASTGVLP